MVPAFSRSISWLAGSCTSVIMVVLVALQGSVRAEQQQQQQSLQGSVGEQIQAPLQAPQPQSLASPSQLATASNSLPGVLSPAQTSASYIIGAGDQLQLTVYGYEEYGKSYLVLSDGTITLPVIGTVEVAGKTPNQLAQLLSQKLDPYLYNPVVTVSLATLRPITITVAGEVQRPGPLQFSNGSTATGATGSAPVANVSGAMVQAGGITRVADVRRVQLIRRQPDGTSQTTTINLWDALVNGREFTNYVLRDGDTLYVPKLAAGESINASLMARSSVAPETVRVRVIGEVKAPGQVAVPPNSTVSSAVAIAGGPTDKAQLREVTLVRLRADGQVDKQTLNMDNLVDTVQVEEGDVVLVPKAGGDKFLDFAGRLLSPLSILVPWVRW